ncbi:MAG: ImmA/IrrE family metallo-endopeptidase [Lachnospiraceae bacterium]|nr:ImmA/IrrE family metallo-endopeptidase [Lachnospiraceae bacterium]
MGITVMFRPFIKQRGAYKIILKNRFVFLKDDLSEEMQRIVLLHEIGHDVLHRSHALEAGGFQEFKLFETNGDRMEYEANVFAAQLSLPDEEILSYIEEGLDIQQIAGIMHTDVNLVALKNDTLIAQGYRFRRQDHTNTFLKFDGSAT